MRLAALWRAAVARREGGLLLLAILMESLVIAGLVAERRMVRIHDGYLQFSLQYYFLNGATTGGSIPQWMPLMTHGMVATVWWAVQANPLQNVLLAAGPLVARLDFLLLYHLGILVQELVLLAGVWLLARRFLTSSLAVFFVATAVLGSSVWTRNPWASLHLVYAVPLVLHFGHRFLERGRWRDILLAGNLLALQALGTVYGLPVTSFVVFVYFASWVALSREGRRQLLALRPTWPALPALLLAALSFVLVFAAMTSGTDQIAYYNPGRDPDGRASLDVFLGYGGATNRRKWLELFLRVSPALDYTLYVGMLAVPFSVIGLALGINRRTGHLLVTLVVTYLFSTGSVLATVAYYTWPMMSYYRHIGVVSVFTKLFLCLVAGLGVDAVLRRGRDTSGRLRFAGALSAAAGATGLVAVGLWWSLGAGDLATWVRSLVYRAGSLETMLGEEHVRGAVGQAAGLAAVAALLVAGMALPGIRRLLVVLALVVAALDLHTYKATQSRLLNLPLSDEEHRLLAFQPMPYAGRRCLTLPCRPTTRYELLRPLATMPGGAYGSAQSFLFEDEIGSFWRLDNWLAPLDDFMRAYGGQAIGDRTTPPTGYVHSWTWHFPVEHPGAAKIAAVTEDKIQFFSSVHVATDAAAVASAITTPDYTGDFLLVTGPASTSDASGGAVPWAGQRRPPSTRIRLPYRVERFDANTLVVTVEAGDHRTAWMLYSDVWHPFWRATVNERPAPVFKANLAYKAVPLGPGRNRVQLGFASPALTILQPLAGVTSLFWLGYVATALVAIFASRRE